MVISSISRFISFCYVTGRAKRKKKFKKNSDKLTRIVEN